MMTTERVAVFKGLLLILPMFGFAEEPNPEKELPARIIIQTMDSLILSGKYEEAAVQGNRFLVSPDAESAPNARRQAIKIITDTAIRLSARESFVNKSLVLYKISEGKNDAIKFASDSLKKWYKVGDEYENATIIYIEESRAVISVVHKRLRLDFEVEILNQNKP